jgi:hypothetical protein
MAKGFTECKKKPAVIFIFFQRYMKYPPGITFGIFIFIFILTPTGVLALQYYSEKALKLPAKGKIHWVITWTPITLRKSDQRGSLLVLCGCLNFLSIMSFPGRMCSSGHITSHKSP